MLTKNANLVLQALQHRLKKTDPDGIVQFVPISKLYQEQGSLFESNSNVYNLNYIFKAVENEPVEYIDISELTWVLKHIDGVDPERVKNADLTVPILVVKYRNKELVVDGLHRLIKATQSRMKKLPYKRVSKEIFEASRIKHALEDINPVYTRW